MDKNKIIKMVIVLAAIVVIAASLSKLLSRDSMSLAEYARRNASSTTAPEETPAPGQSPPAPAETAPAASSREPSPEPAKTPEPSSQLTGAALNGSSQEEERYTLKDGFYCEPLSEKLCRYMTGASYPSAEEETDFPAPSFDDLLYVHILHYDFQGDVTEGELVCNRSIAADLLEIFYELYRNEYKLESVLLTDEYDGDELLSMEHNNSSAFNCPSTDEEHALRHSQGTAVDINPLYNPCVLYHEDGSQQVIPSQASDYANRAAGFPYKINEEDLCYKLFLQHGFTWGGNWNDGKCYQHFQKNLP